VFYWIRTEKCGVTFQNTKSLKRQREDFENSSERETISFIGEIAYDLESNFDIKKFP